MFSFRWFDAREAREFGIALARFYIERVLPDASAGKHKRAGKKLEVLEKMTLQIAQFKQLHKMNLYKKAKFGNAFRWSLVDAGYDAADADELTNYLLLRF